MKFLENDLANISMDFLTAISVLMITLVYAVSAIPTFFTPYTTEDNFPHLDSTLSVFLSPNNENGLAIPHTDILDGETISQHYITHENDLNWYELHNQQTFKTFGFENYQYYSQILPVDDTRYNIHLAEQSAKNHVPEFGNTELVVRFKTLEYTESGIFYGKDLYGKVPKDEVLIYFNENDTKNIINNVTLTFKDFIAENDGDTIGILKSFDIGTEVNESREIKTPKHITPIIIVNGNIVDTTHGVNINLTDAIKITISEVQLNNKISWQNGFYFQFNTHNIEINEGETYYNSSIHKISEPYKISVWSW